MFCLFSILFVIVVINNTESVKLQIYANDTYISKIYIGKVRESLRLTCKLLEDNDSHYNKCILEWKKPKFIQNNHNRIRPNIEQNEATLDILSLQRSDIGQYTCLCKALNLTAKITLNVKPLSIPYCGQSMFVCEKSEKCIAQHYVCDGKIDCKYGEDEHYNQCGTDACIGKIRNCKDGRCIPANWCCNTDLDPNCTVKERPSCCRQQFKLIQEQSSGYSEYHSFKHGLLKATIFTLFVGAVLFFFLVSICLLVLCRIHIHSCPANQDIREVCSRTRIPFYDFYLYLNRNWNNLDHSCVQQRPALRSALYSNGQHQRQRQHRSQRVADQTNSNFSSGFDIGSSVNRSIPHSILLMSYLNNEVQYIHRPASPPPYSEICDTTIGITDPPPPYVSRENISEPVNNDDQCLLGRGYVLVTTHSDDEDVNQNINDTNTSCAIYDSPTPTPSVPDTKTVLPNQLNTSKKYDIKKLRQEFLGATTSTNFSDSECSTSDCEFSTLYSSLYPTDIENNNNIFEEISDNKNDNKIDNSSETTLNQVATSSAATTTNGVKLRETHVDSTENVGKRSTNTRRPRSLNCDIYLPSRSSQQSDLNSTSTTSRLLPPLIKCNSGNLNSFSDHDDDSTFTDSDRPPSKSGRLQLSIRHSIADLSPSGSSEYKYFEIPTYDRESRLLTLPLRESFIGLRKE